jgi:hypothetical protein
MNAPLTLDLRSNPTASPCGVRQRMIARALAERIVAMSGVLYALPPAPGCELRHCRSGRHAVGELARRGAVADAMAITYGDKPRAEEPERIFSRADIASGAADGWIVRLWNSASQRTRYYLDEKRWD